MSFRLRVLLLVLFLVATSTAATAWLTVRQASRQLTESVAASQRDVTATVDQLARYGQAHGGWDGIEAPVRDLADRLGQRIRVVSESGAVLADSDLLAGRVARPVGGAASVVDPRPEPPSLTGYPPETRAGVVKKVIGAYRWGWSFAGCLRRAGVGVVLTHEAGVPRFRAVDPPPAVVDRCGQEAVTAVSGGETAARFRDPCPSGEDVACLQRAFTDEISRFAPQPLRVYVGARDEVPAELSTGSIMLAASAVAVAALLTAVLLTRRVVKPITALTAASRRLGAGELTERVPVTGRDELAQLGRAFNRMAESLARSEDRQRRLVADVAHELRTPLANLRGYLEALSDGVLPPSPELFDSLHEEALLQQRIVDDLQDLALAEAGTLVYHHGTVDLGELVETCRTTHAAVADAAGITLTADVAAAVRARADPDRLRQVLGNLIRNAVTATAAGGTIRLTVGLGRHELGDRALVHVADTGRGIAESDLPHVFDRFWRADGARRRDTGGSGLGLAITRQILTDHGGGIEVSSRLGAGTVFTVWLPALVGPSPAAVVARGRIDR